MISKIFNKSLVQTGFKTISNNKQAVFAASNAFSTSALERLDKGKVKLTKALAREIKFEEENYQYDESVNTFLEENGFELKDVETDQFLELTKQVGGAKVTVYFQSRAPQLNDEGEGQEQEDEVDQSIQRNQEEGEEEQYPNQDFCDFTVYVSQPNGKSLAFECTSFDSEINVSFVSLVDNLEEHKTANKLERNFGYSADFNILDERLQTAFLEYLKGFGVDEKLAIFVEHISLDKDQRLYVDWLRNVNNFVASQ